MSNILDKRTDNFLYAPGIATYGVDGKTGETGEKGTAIFYTDYNFTDATDDDDLTTLLYCIKNSRCLIKAYASTSLSRPYIDGDYIVCASGEIYKMKNLDSISDYMSGTLYNEYFSLAGRIDSTVDDKVYFENLSNGTNDRIINKSEYGGLDVRPVDFTFDGDDNYTLRIGCESNSATGDQLGKALACVAQNGLNESEDLKFYYDLAADAWFISSSTPVMIDAASVKVQDRDADQSVPDNYSEVITSQTPITGFYNAVKACSWEYADKAVTVAVEGDDSAKKTAWAMIVTGQALLASLYYSDGTHKIISVSSDNCDSSNYTITVPLDDDSKPTYAALIKNIEVFIS